MTIATPNVEIGLAPEPRYLSGPISDFLMLGGVTLLIFPLLIALPSDSFEGPLGAITFWLAFAINHPHFAVSYRMFYEGFGPKLANRDGTDPTLRYRYMIAGIVAPAVLGVGILAVAITASSELLGYGFNLMGFFVGWHYIKQAYGMAMVDSALKRRYLPAFDKKVLLVNGYAVWGFSWASLNSTSEPIEYAGVTVSLLNLPSILAWVLGAVALGSTLVLLYTFGRRALLRIPTAWIGIAAYLVSLYLWMVLVRTNPLFILVTPALHSLQYLWVVRKFQKNRHSAGSTNRSWMSQYWGSALLGSGMFFFFPIILDVFLPLDKAVWGTVPFLFMSIIFINIHHYFLDNVMWRRGNPEVSQHLFA